MTSMPQDFIFFKKCLDFFLLLVPHEILSHYPDIDISYCFREDVQWVMDNVFREKLMV